MPNSTDQKISVESAELLSSSPLTVVLLWLNDTETTAVLWNGLSAFGKVVCSDIKVDKTLLQMSMIISLQYYMNFSKQ